MTGGQKVRIHIPICYHLAIALRETIKWFGSTLPLSPEELYLHWCPST